MSQWDWGHLAWYGIFVALVFGALETSGYLHVAPWPTFSATIQHDAHRHPWFAAITAAAVVGVGVHWLFDQKLLPSLFFGLSLAVSAHLLDNRWP